LCVSAALEHKNLARLIAALPRLTTADAPVLVIAGHQGREGEHLVAAAARHGVTSRVRSTGWISQRDLEGLYAVATCCVYPSLFEGFGLPVLEAMRRGVPLACSDATSLPEVAGDAAEFFDPSSEAAIAAAVSRLLTDPARAAELVRRGRARAEGYTWEATAQGVLDCYQRTLQGGGARLQ
jgi:glycosyltransferase involved in cell wall biosynthesis